FTYLDTAQERCLRLMGQKLLVSLAMEGKLHAEGLQALGDGDDLLTAMARELVTRHGVGERAAAVWKALVKAREPMTGVSIGQGRAAASADVARVQEKPIAQSVCNRAAVQLSLF